MQSVMRILVYLLLVLVALGSCDSREEGCLDTLSTNFDVDAVAECDSCCVYPTVSLSLNYDYDTIENFVFRTLYPYVGEDSIRIVSLQLPFSEIIYYSEGQAIHVIDTIRGQSSRIYDDFLVITQSQRTNDFGSTITVGPVDSINLRMGLDENFALGLRPYEDVEINSRFIEVIEDMYVDSISTLFQARIAVEIGDSLRSLEIKEIVEPELSLQVEDTSLLPGIPWTIGLTMDLRVLIDGISKEDTNEMMEKTIAQNISASIIN